MIWRPCSWRCRARRVRRGAAAAGRDRGFGARDPPSRQARRDRGGRPDARRLSDCNSQDVYLAIARMLLLEEVLVLPEMSVARLEPFPDTDDLGAVLVFLAKQRKLAALNRKAGDEAQQSGDRAQAAKAWQAASQQNLHALAVRDVLRGQPAVRPAGQLVRGRNYPLEGKEADFAADSVADTPGRQGGLYRRLGTLDNAQRITRSVPASRRAAAISRSRTATTR